MRHVPTPEDAEHLAVLNPAPWQVALLSLNPGYCSWGNYEDYMSGGEGWDMPIELPSISEAWGLDDLNELVNFYFELYRKGHNCPHCDGTGMSPAYKRLSDEWYGYGLPEDWRMSTDGRKRWNNNAWSNHITEVEITALLKHGRLMDFTHEPRTDEQREIVRKKIADGGNSWLPRGNGYIPTPEEVNAWNRNGIGHDSINQWVCVQARADHMGMKETACRHCQDGTIYDEETGTIGLQLWMIHPRKGCSRGVYIQRIEESDLPKVYELLQQAAARKAERFSRVTELKTT